MVEIRSLLFWVDCYGGCEWIVKVSLWWWWWWWWWLLLLLLFFFIIIIIFKLELWWWILGVDFWVCLDL